MSTFTPEDLPPLIGQMAQELCKEYGFDSFDIQMGVGHKPFFPAFCLSHPKCHTYLYSGGNYWLVFQSDDLILEPITVFKEYPLTLAPNEIWMITVDDQLDTDDEDCGIRVEQYLIQPW